MVQSFHNENVAKLRGHKSVLPTSFKLFASLLRKYVKILKLLPAVERLKSGDKNVMLKELLLKLISLQSWLS